jgi:hypothetical protein
MAWMRDDFDRESGVTYVGARSFVAVFAVVCAVFVGIAFGASRIVDAADAAVPSAVAGPASTPFAALNWRTALVAPSRTVRTPTAPAALNATAAPAPARMTTTPASTRARTSSASTHVTTVRPALRVTVVPPAVRATAAPAAISATAVPTVIPAAAMPPTVRALAEPAAVRVPTAPFMPKRAAKPAAPRKHVAAMQTPHSAGSQRAIAPLASAALTARGTLAPGAAPVGFFSVRTPTAPPTPAP